MAAQRSTCKRGLSVGLLLSCLVMAGAALAAEGNELFAYSAIHKSLGGAGAAHAQDATWVLINPAAIVDLDRRLDFSFELLHIHVLSEPEGCPLLSSPLAGAMNFKTWVEVPSFAAIFPQEHFTLGVGVIGVAGNQTNFDHPRATLALIGNGDRRAANEVARIPLAVAHRFDSGWSVGAAIVPAVQRFRTDSFTTRIRTTQGDNEPDWALGLGYIVSVYRDFGAWSVGAAYTSRTWMQSFEKYEKDLTFWELDLPQRVQAGIAWRPLKKLEVLLDYKWVNWSAVELFGNKTVHGGLGWEDQRIVNLGAGWQVNDRWTVRAGVSAGNPVVTNKFVFANLLTPAVAKLHFGAGVSYQFNEQSSVHATYSQSIPEEDTDSGKGDLFSVLGRGSKVGYREHSLTLQYTRRF